MPKEKIKGKINKIMNSKYGLFLLLEINKKDIKEFKKLDVDNKVEVKKLEKCQKRK